MMRVSELVARSGGAVELIQGDAAREISEIVIDSRQAVPGSLFIALEGARFDAHRFVPGVVQAGASAILVRRGREAEFDPQGVAVLVTDDTRAVLGPLSAAIYDDPTREVLAVGITGTNGKTTCSYLMEWVFRGLGFTPGVIGTVNYRWPGTILDAPNTTPESLVVQQLARRMRDDDVDALVMEVSSHGLATHRLDGTTFDVGVFTNLTQDHLDFHGSMREYRDAKARLFVDHLRPPGHGLVPPSAVLNFDDPEGRRLAEVISGDTRIISYGRGGADLVARDELHSADGLRFTLTYAGSEHSVAVPMVGAYNVSNVLAVLGVVVARGLSLSDAIESLSTFPGVPGRLERVRDAPVTFVDYAHTPDALERSLEALLAVAPAKVSVVFGCGGDRDQGKRPVMGAVAGRLADRVYVTSDNPRHEDPDSILDDIVRGFAEGQFFVREVDRASAIWRALDESESEDIVLVAGKGHETYQEIGDERRDFDDREIVRSWGGAAC